ncbi:MAG: hypothetical protein KC776_18400 [Myxococcales bacterium]|nr:hypothetical protein [Myxococcales bacterium]MCB9579286.1 hypothetical protein [Polyangiaceae bacterium]
MRFTLFGIPVHVQPIFWLVALMLGLPGGTGRRELAELAIWIGVLFVSILVHELGHATAMRVYGRAARIELWGLGGLTHWGPGPPVTPGKNIVVSLAGPGAGLLLGAVVFVVAGSAEPAPESLASVLVSQALWINVGWGIANLVPMLPLDGGHVTESLGGWIAGARGRRVAHGLSLALAVLIGAFALYSRMLWIGFLALWCASISWRAWSSGGNTAPAEPEVDANVRAGLRQAWLHLVAGQAESAVRVATELLERTRPDDAVTRTAVLEALAWAHIEEGDEEAALRARARMPRAPSPLLAARLLVAEGRVADGVARLEEAFQNESTDFPALVLSSVYVEQERPDLAVKMLLSKRGAKLSSETHVTIGAQLFHSGSYEAALEATSLAFERFKTGVHAYNAACSLARLGRVDEGIAWLEKAVLAGFDDGQQLDDDEDIAALREDPRFGALRSAVGRGAR